MLAFDSFFSTSLARLLYFHILFELWEVTAELRGDSLSYNTEGSGLCVILIHLHWHWGFPHSSHSSRKGDLSTVFLSRQL